MKNRITLIVLIFFFNAWTASPSAAAAKGISFVRDAEVENTIRTFAKPLFVAAGLNSASVRIHLVKDDKLNAFVAAGQNIFINTGLIAKARDAGALIGVLAHETGHIAAGHLVRAREAFDNATAQSILGMILSGAATLGGRPDVGSAILQGTRQSGLRTFLHFSRTQEAVADRAAARFLEATGQSARGLYDFLKVLEDQELLSARHQDPYFQTHPMTRNRLNFLLRHMEGSRYTEVPVTPQQQRLHRRMKAKLLAFTQPPGKTLREFPPADKTIAARYARAIAYFRIPKLDEALAEIDWLIARESRNPYFHELKGQMLFENGRIAASVAPYQTAVDLSPKSALLRIGLGQSLIESNDRAVLPRAIVNLRAAVGIERTLTHAWRLLAIGYGRTGRMGKSFLSLAEEALLQKRVGDATRHAEKAMKLVAKESPDWLTAGDIIRAAKAGKRKR